MKNELFNLLEFVEGILQLNYEDFSIKYRNKIPADITIKQAMDFLSENNLSEKIIDPDFDDVSNYRFPFNIVKTEDGNFTVFSIERGGRLIQLKTDTLKHAIKEKLEMIFNDQSHTPADGRFARPR